MKKKRASFTWILLIIFFAIIGAGAYVSFKDMTGPVITMENERERVSPSQEIMVDLSDEMSGIRAVQVVVKKNSQSMIILRENYAQPEKNKVLRFVLKDAKLPDGNFELEIKSSDGSLAGFGKGNSTTKTWALRLDTQAPRIAVKTVTPGIRQGGAALIRYTLSEECQKSGVKIGDDFYPGYLYGTDQYVCIFPFAYNYITTSFTPEIMAVDLAGNITASKLLVNASGKTFTKDNMIISDSFLNAKSAEFDKILPNPELNPLEKYVNINKVVRIENDKLLKDLAAKSSPNKLWEGTFGRLPKSAVKANFGDFRTYLYGEQVIDEQTHIGLDLASVANADVPAANNGIVLFADYLGIYGNLVVIDHGLGLMTIYSHLDDIKVQVGQELKKADVIGVTGTTGLAGGDHVHFGFLVGGQAVNPIEWLDDNWLKNNIVNRMK